MRPSFRQRLFRVAATALVLTGCGEVPPTPSSPQTVRQALSTPNGSNLNGSNLNGSNLNGSNLNGSNLNSEALGQTLVSVAYAGALREGLSGNKLDAVWLEGTVFHGTQGQQTFSGLDFNQARFQGTLGSGARVWLRVDAMTPHTGPDGDLWTYRVSYQEPRDGLWYPVCKGEGGTALDAIPVAGRWDYRHGLPGEGGRKIDDPAAFTFGCEGAAIAKCVRWGYKPWASVQGVSLAAHHQTCTRLVRADFCGDGTSHTVTGQWVNLYDTVGIQADTEDWYMEAEWDANGARCFSPHNRSHEHVSCYDARKESSCGQPGHFSTGTLVMTETPTRR
jgi:hypothetical protein